MSLSVFLKQLSTEQTAQLGAELFIVKVQVFFPPLDLTDSIFNT